MNEDMQWLSYTFDLASLKSPQSGRVKQEPSCDEDAVVESWQRCSSPTAQSTSSGGSFNSNPRNQRRTATVERKRSSDGAGFRESPRPAKLLSPTSASGQRVPEEPFLSPLTSQSGESMSGSSVSIKGELFGAGNFGFGEMSPTYYVPNASSLSLLVQAKKGGSALAVDTSLNQYEPVEGFETAILGPSNNNNKEEDESNYGDEDDSTPGNTPRLSVGSVKHRFRSTSSNASDCVDEFALLGDGSLLSQSWSGPMTFMGFDSDADLSTVVPLGEKSTLLAKKAAATPKPRKPRSRKGSGCSSSSNLLSPDATSAGETKNPDNVKKVIRIQDPTCAQGRWQPEEIRLLLHIALAYFDSELKTIGEVARFCGLNRPLRAIDKQLKRLLLYEKWNDRGNSDQVRNSIQAHLHKDQYSAPLCESVKRKLEEAEVLWEKKDATVATPRKKST